MVCYDLDMQLLEGIKLNDFDVILVDLIDECFNLSVLPHGNIATCSSEFLKSGIPTSRSINKYSDEFF